MAETERISIEFGNAVFCFVSKKEAEKLRDILNWIFPPERISAPFVWDNPPIETTTISSGNFFAALNADGSIRVHYG